MDVKRCLFLVAFNMYDLDNDNKISRSELLGVLHMMVGANITDEQVHYSKCIPFKNKTLSFFNLIVPLTDLSYYYHVYLTAIRLIFSFKTNIYFRILSYPIAIVRVLDFAIVRLFGL